MAGSNKEDLEKVGSKKLKQDNQNESDVEDSVKELNNKNGKYNTNAVEDFMKIGHLVDDTEGGKNKKKYISIDLFGFLAN